MAPRGGSALLQWGTPGEGFQAAPREDLGAFRGGSAYNMDWGPLHGVWAMFNMDECRVWLTGDGTHALLVRLEPPVSMDRLRRTDHWEVDMANGCIRIDDDVYHLVPYEVWSSTEPEYTA